MNRNEVLTSYFCTTKTFSPLISSISYQCPVLIIASLKGAYDELTYVSDVPAYHPPPVIATPAVDTWTGHGIIIEKTTNKMNVDMILDILGLMKR